MLLYASIAKLLLYFSMLQSGLSCQMPVKLASSIIHVTSQT